MYKISPKNVSRNKWMSKALLKSSKKNYKLFIKQIGKPKISSERDRYIKYCNMFNRLKIIAKKNYYHEQVEKHKSDSKQLWNMINELTGKIKDKSYTISLITHNGKEIQLKLGNCLMNILLQLVSVANNLKDPDQTPKRVYNRKVPKRKFDKLEPITEIEITKIVNKIPNKTSCGHDGVSNIVRSNLAIHLSDTPFVIRQPIRRPCLLERVYRPIRTPHWCGVLPLIALEIRCK